MDSIEYYNKYAASVFEETVDQDMGEILEKFLEELREGDTILDLGCGSGRDSLVFYERGFDVTLLDASEEMCRLAEVHTGLDTLQMKYEEMEFDDVFDGVWACASLLHVPKSEMGNILSRIARSLKDRGILYMSFKRGDFEGFRGERYFSDYTEDSMIDMLRQSGRFQVLEIWETPDFRPGHDGQLWLNVLAQKERRASDKNS